MGYSSACEAVAGRPCNGQHCTHFDVKTARSGVLFPFGWRVCSRHREGTSPTDLRGGAEVSRLGMSGVKIRPSTDVPPHCVRLAVHEVHPVDHARGAVHHEPDVWRSTCWFRHKRLQCRQALCNWRLLRRWAASTSSASQMFSSK